MAAQGQRTGCLLFLLCALTVLVLDQTTKLLACSVLVEHQPVTAVPGLFDWCLVFNRGAAFGLGEGFAWLFVIIALLIFLICLGYVILCKPGRLLCCVMGFVAGGGLANLLDRVARGAVTDFILPTCVDFAVFNVADIFITLGFVASFVLIWKESPSEVDANDKDCG